MPATLARHVAAHHRDDLVRALHTAKGVAGTLGMQPAPFIVAAILSGGIVCGFGLIMPARTAKGAEALEGVLGFEEFLGRVEADRFERMVKTPQLFEKYLPFAMALGVEHRWAKAFEGIVQNPPTWYQGTDGRMFNAIYFVNSIGSMTQYASAAFVSAPRASSSSSGWSGGFSGGGFSGGGFGGGGTGGF